jgi:hypothetical protein
MLLAKVGVPFTPLRMPPMNNLAIEALSRASRIPSAPGLTAIGEQ